MASNKGVKMADESLTEMIVHDLSNRGLHSIEFNPGTSPQSLIYDGNFVTQLENLHRYENLIKLSVANNQILDMTGITALRNLTSLNLANNNISLIQGLRHLSKLTKLNLSGNKIKLIENLSHNINLQYLDLSENSISSLSDIRGLLRLKTLLLHGNQLTSLRQVPQTLPRSTAVLSLADNNIADLNEVSHLFHLNKLEQLSVIGNPCVLLAESSLQFDYRPFVVNWCVNLKLLDDREITAKEGLRAEWLLSQGKGRHFHSGQHNQLFQYLATVCPTTGSEMDKEEEVKLKRVLQQQRLHQQQQQQLMRDGGGHAARHDTDTSHHQQSSVSNRTSYSPKRALSDRKSSPSSVASSFLEKSPHIGGVGGGKGAGEGIGTGSKGTPYSTASSTPVRSQQGLVLEDVGSADESLSMLECETRYLPLPTEFTSGPASHLVAEIPLSLPEKTNSQSNPDEPVPSKSSVGGSAVRPATQSRRIAAIFGSVVESSGSIVKPMPSSSHPQTHVVRKRSSSPLTKTVDIRSSDSSSVASGVGAIAAEQHSVKAAALHSRKTTPTSDTREKTSTAVKALAVGSSLGDHEVECEREAHPNHPSKSMKDAKNWNRFQNNLATTEPEEDLKRTRAAVMLQALWRGYVVRRDSSLPTAVHTIRSDEHICHISSLLNRHSDRFEKDKLLWSHQVELMKHLLKEVVESDLVNLNQAPAVQSLQDWKNQVISSQDQMSTLSRHQLPGTAESSTSSNLDSTQRLMETMEKLPRGIDHLNPHLSLASPKPTIGKLPSSESPSVFQFTPAGASSSSQMMASQRELELEVVCQGLQKQVNELKEVLSSLSSLSLAACGSNVVSLASDVTGGEKDGPETTEAAVTTTSRSGCLPLPPTELTVDDVTLTSAVLNWKHSLVPSVNLKAKAKLIIGYRIYINNEPWAMVSSIYNSAILNTLTPNCLYKVHLKAVGSLGESYNSNVVEFRTSAVTASAVSAFQSDDPNNTNGKSDRTNVNLASREMQSRKTSQDQSVQGRRICSEEKSKECQSSDQPVTSAKHGLNNSAVKNQITPSNRATEAKNASTEGGIRAFPKSVEKPNQTFPPCMPPLLKDDHQVKPTSTYPASIRKSSQNFSILEKKMEITEATKDVFLAAFSKTAEAEPTFFPKAAEAEPVSAGEAEDVRLDELDLKGLNDEIRYVPKPPDDAVTPRRNSMTRRSSLRRRNNSNNKSPVETTSASEVTPRDDLQDRSDDVTVASRGELPEGSSGTCVRSTSDPFFRGGGEGTGPSRSRPLLKISSESESRSSSLGAQMRDCSGERTAFTVDKPPVNRRNSSTERISSRKRTMSGDKIQEKQSSPPEMDFQGLKCRSETSMKHSEQTKPQVILKPAKDEMPSSKASKAFLAHNRCKSDFKALPDHPRSPAPIEKTPPASTNAPTRSPSSPTLRRSSSFSIAIRNKEENDSAKAQLRQCISLETLRAVKKSLGKEPEGAVAKKESFVSVEQSPHSQTPDAASGQRSKRSSGSSKGSSPDQPSTSGHTPPAASSTTTPNSVGPKLSTKKSDSGSKSRFGNKASSLFSQLHKKISANK